MSKQQKYTGDTSITTELPINFHTLTGESVPAVLRKVNFQSFEDSLSCQMMIEVSGQTYQDIMENEWFNLFASMRTGSSAAMDENQPVEVHVALRPSLTKLAAQHGFDAEAIFDSVRSSTEPTSKLLSLDHTECWLALELKQSVVLPEALKDEGVLKMGFRTAWAAEMDQGISVPEEPSIANGALNEHITSFLTDNELKYEVIDDQLYKLIFTSRGESWVGLIRIEEVQDYCAVYSVYPELVPEHQRQELALLLLNENMDLLSGSFELDDEDGELRFRSSYYAGNTYDSEVFSRILGNHLEAVESYFSEIREVLKR
ncbi:YbjN domain-containing protein [Paenibacillus sp. MCAF9]|uniref:YbjN domain-containing protein n=1 Tax=Paenibacillus sp. MCAF9 TaxID=3233046 RepID=UPI003F99DCF8